MEGTDGVPGSWLWHGPDLTVALGSYPDNGRFLSVSAFQVNVFKNLFLKTYCAAYILAKESSWWWLSSKCNHCPFLLLLMKSTTFSSSFWLNWLVLPLFFFSFAREYDIMFWCLSTLANFEWAWEKENMCGNWSWRILGVKKAFSRVVFHMALWLPSCNRSKWSSCVVLRCRENSLSLEVPYSVSIERNTFLSLLAHCWVIASKSIHLSCDKP